MLGALARMKDGALALALRAYVGERFKEYGELIDVTVDTGANRLTMEAMLRGERDPVTAIIERYDIENVDGEQFIVLRQFSSSRPWLTLLLTQLFAGKRYRLPAPILKLL